MKKLFRPLALAVAVLFALCGALVAPPAMAGTMTAPIAGYWAAQNGYVLVYFAGTISGRPACATQNWFVIDPSTQNGKNQFSAVQLAFALGKTVSINGTNTCGTTYFTDSEQVYNVNTVQ